MLTDAFGLALATKDAYSFIRYGISGWQELTRLLLKHGLTPVEAETVLRSKWTRWAADQQAARYGRMSGRKAFAYIRDCKGLGVEQLAELSTR